MHKQKFLAYLFSTFDVNVDFPASVSADSLLAVSRAMVLGLAAIYQGTIRVKSGQQYEQCLETCVHSIS